MLKKTIAVLLILLLLYTFLTLIVVEVGYSILGFNSHVFYESILSPKDYGLNVLEHDLNTSDNVKVHIYETIVEDPKGVVIFLSGITNPSVTHFYGHAQLVSTIGFASILLDLRGHGKSDGNEVTLAIDDVKDVNAAVEYINGQQQYHDLPIVVMGVSMGGATAINAASLNPEIDGLIALSAYSSWTDVCVDNIEQQGFPRVVGEIMRPAIILHGFLNYGMDFFEVIPKETIEKIGDKPILFIHCTEDTEVPISNHYRLMKHYSGNNAEIWIRDSYCHFVVNDNKMDTPYHDMEYCDRILNFLKSNF